MTTVHPDNSNLPLINQPQTVLGIIITFLSLAITAISLRLWVRYQARIWGWDDLIVLCAGISTTIGSTFACTMPYHGLGKHFWTLDPQTVQGYYKGIWATNSTYTLSATLIKLAILFQYLRLFDMQIALARRLTLSLIIVVALWGSTFFFLALFACNPIAKNWDFDLPGTCVAWGSKNPDIFFATWAAHAATNMSFDILILCLPLPFLKGLRIQGKARLGLIGLFTVGGIVVLLSAARMIVLSVNRAGTIPVFDPSYSTPSIFVCSVLEVNIAIICASVPIFWPLVTDLAGNKILVVQEIEIRTDARDSRGLALAEQGANTSGWPDDTKGSSHNSILEQGKENGHIISMKTLSRARSISLGKRMQQKTHKVKPSTASSMMSAQSEINRTISHESQRGLAHHSSNVSLASLGPDGALKVGPDGSAAKYKDPYMQDWAVPNFQKEISASPPAAGAGSLSTTASSTAPAFKTTVERAEIPFDHIKAFEDRSS